ncbi:hypothetical protein [Helicobacter pametensis]|uniref:hypothetical protein n=1 Tax=Helicobacter pametensis TaxID=95149 RepID=UPI000484205A|nr:hypothetical protein [Helicobacter pametensis]
MKAKALLLTLLLNSCLFAFPSHCYDAISGDYDLQTGKEKSLQKDEFKLYFKRNEKDFFVSGNQSKWNPLIMIADNIDNSQFLEPVDAGFVLYTYHKQIKKMVIQKSYSYPLFGSLVVTAVLNKCVE